MAMKLQLYHEISSAVRAEQSVEWLSRVAAKFPKTSQTTLSSIGSQIRRRDTIRTLHTHKRPHVMVNYYKSQNSNMVVSPADIMNGTRGADASCIHEANRYLAGKQDKKSQVLLNMAREVSLAPTLLARIILEKYAASKPQINSWIKNPSFIPDIHLAEEVQHCTENDPEFGPDAVEERRQTGITYEEILREKLDSHDLCYLDEDAMRKRGYDKTPDVKMEVPFAVCGHIVNWVESKALFGDPESHRQYLNDQYWAYLNRFGPGLVIYWFGYIDELDVHQDKGIMLRDTFPTSSEILTMPV